MVSIWCLGVVIAIYFVCSMCVVCYMFLYYVQGVSAVCVVFFSGVYF